MIDKIGYEDWRELFIKEKKGKAPEDAMYNPAQGIKIAPYLDQKEENSSTFPHSKSSFSHSFLIDPTSAKWLPKNNKNLKSYDIKSILHDIDTVWSGFLESQPIISREGLKAYNPKMENDPLILDFENVDILSVAKRSIETLKSTDNEIWIIPGHDFLWNTALLRGIRKYQNRHSESTSFSDKFSIYAPLNQFHRSTEESQLIAISNQFLSLMIGGLSHCIWDIRNATEWQKANITHLLSVPEILVREGKVLVEEDPVAGSDFFEELSDKVVNFLHE